MERLEEIKARKLELRELLEDETKEVNLDEVKSEIDSLEAEENALKEAAEATEKQEESEAEERRSIAESIETRNSNETKIIEKEEEKKMEEKRYDVSSPEYRTAWAKKLMGKDNELTEVEKKALGDAIGTTATTFVESDASTQGINNLGLLIPTSVRKDFLEILSEESPIFRDIRKLAVASNIDLPYLDEADDAEWYAELSDTKNEGQEYKSLKLTGHELAKDVVITWKAEAMTVEGFIDFILDELRQKMGKALINAVIYGDGSGKPSGITKDLVAVTTGADPIANIVATYKSLDSTARIGAKAYISTNVNIEIVGYKDNNGNYPFLNGVATNKLVPIEVDPYLRNNDLVIGNCRNYILNEVEPLSVDREKTIKGRKVTYGGYGIFDGGAKAGKFAYGKYTPNASI